MPATIRYLIHSCHETSFPATAEIDGRPVPVSVPGLVVEAETPDGSMGHSFKLVHPEDLDAAKAEFGEGNVLTVTLSGAPAA